MIFVWLVSCKRTNNCNDNELNSSEESWAQISYDVHVKYLSNYGDTVNGTVYADYVTEKHYVQDNCGTGRTVIGYTRSTTISGLTFYFSLSHDVRPKLLYTTLFGSTEEKELGFNSIALTIDTTIYSDTYTINFDSTPNDSLAPVSVSYSKKSGIISWSTSTSKTYNIFK